MSERALVPTTSAAATKPARPAGGTKKHPVTASRADTACAPLPATLLARLNAAAGRVVAPVGVGCNAGALERWALDRGWVVCTEPPLAATSAPAAAGATAATGVANPKATAVPERWLWCPARRSALLRADSVADTFADTFANTFADSAATGTADEMLVLADQDTQLSLEDWSDALSGQAPAQVAATWQATRGWPAALPLARALPGDTSLHLHPMATLVLAGCLPPPALRDAAQRLAVATLATPGVAAALGVPHEQLLALHDGGWLWHEPRGWSFPETLRRLLCPHPAPEAARAAARALRDEGHDDEALQTLRFASAWDGYLALLSLQARAAQGEEALRQALQPLPERWRSEPAALYVAGLQARAAGDSAAAVALYSRALQRGLEPPVAALAHNARGVVHAMAGAVDQALSDFDAATQGGGRVAGEAAANRATLLIRLCRHDEAEASLREAIAAFRAVGDVQREARSVGSLGGLQFGRGLLREAAGLYRKALELLLPAQPREATLTHLNLAECHVWLGDRDAVRLHVEAAAGLDAICGHDGAGGWLTRLRALVLLQAGAAQEALALLDGLASDDAGLRAEVALLRAAALRALKRPSPAREALREAESLGLRTQLERAALEGSGADAALCAVIDAARREGARLELATALLRRGRDADLVEALSLIRAEGYLGLLDDPAAAALAPLAADAETRALFPLRLQLLGPLRMSFAGRTFTLQDFPTRKSAALLVALALAGKAQPREALAERFWGEAKNPLASLQTAVYHLRATLGVAIVGTERGMLSVPFSVDSDIGEIDAALRGNDTRRRGRALAALQHPVSALCDLQLDLDDERTWAQRRLRDAMRGQLRSLPEGDARRRDALRDLVSTDPLDTESREELIRWHEARGEHGPAEEERRRWKQALGVLGI